MEEDIWEVFCNNQNPDKIKIYHRRTPVNGGYKLIKFVSLQWGGTKTENWPSLHTSGWYFHKWTNKGILHRSIVTQISITRNMDNGNLRCKFRYDTNNYKSNCWNFC